MKKTLKNPAIEQDDNHFCQTGVIGFHLIYEIYTVVSFDVCIGLPRRVLDCEHEST